MNVPTEKHIGVVGAGIVGVSTAIWLARDGHRVTLIDREGPAAGASFGNAGILASSSVVPVPTPGLVRKAPGLLLRRDGPLFLRWRYLPRLLPWLYRYLSYRNGAHVERIAQGLMPIIGDSVEQHLAIARDTPAERFIEPVAYTYVYKSRDAYRKDGFAWGIRRRLGFHPEELDEQALRDLEPNLGPAHRFAISVPDHAWIRDPGAYVKALFDHAISSGTTFEKGRVEGFVHQNSAVRGVILDGNARTFDAVVIAAGVWSKGLLEKLGSSVSMESERGYHIELERAEGGPSRPMALAEYKFIATPMDGRLRLAGLVEFGGLDAPPSEAPYELLLRQAKNAFPALRWAGEKRWLGHRPATDDSLPVIGCVAPGAYAAFGHHHVGLTGGPKTGRLIADLIARRTPNFDMQPYRSDRFDRRG